MVTNHNAAESGAVTTILQHLLILHGKQQCAMSHSNPALPCVQEQYLELTSAVPPTSILYGLGERTQSAGLSLQRGKEPITLWNRDQPSLAPDQNLYG